MARIQKPRAEELERAAGFRSALRRFLHRAEEITAAAGLSPQRYDLLLMIKTADGEASTVTELARRLDLHQPAVSELAKRAEAAALVVRERSPRDGRVTVLRLTEEGERRLRQAFAALGGERRKLVRAIGEIDA